MKVMCQVDYDMIADDDGRFIDSVVVTCERCDHVCTAYGTSEASVKRALAQLRETCPLAERNFYVVEEML